MKIVGKFTDLEKLRLARGFTTLSFAAIWFCMIGLIFSLLGWAGGDAAGLFIFGIAVFFIASFMLEHLVEAPLLHRTKQCDPLCNCREEQS